MVNTTRYKETGMERKIEKNYTSYIEVWNGKKKSVCRYRFLVTWAGTQIKQ